MSDDEILARAAAAIRGKEFSSVSVDLVNDMVERERGADLVASLLGLERKGNGDEYLKAVEVMSQLQEWVEKDSSSALILMAHLYPIADDLYAHDICDSINIWVWQKQSELFRKRLKPIAEKCEDESLRRYYEDWLK